MDIISFLNEEKQYYVKVVIQLEKSIEQSNEQDKDTLNYILKG